MNEAEQACVSLYEELDEDDMSRYRQSIQDAWAAGEQFNPVKDLELRAKNAGILEANKLLTEANEGLKKQLEELKFKYLRVCKNIKSENKLLSDGHVWLSFASTATFKGGSLKQICNEADVMLEEYKKRFPND